VFSIIKVQRINPVSYLLEDYHGKSIARAFYEYELHRATHPDVYLMGKLMRRKGNEVNVKWLGWIAQLMDTQGQCVVKINL